MGLDDMGIHHPIEQSIKICRGPLCSIWNYIIVRAMAHWKDLEKS
jgi:hypothetical protein